MEQDFALEKARFIENYNLARPIMTILGDAVQRKVHGLRPVHSRRKTGCLFDIGLKIPRICRNEQVQGIF